MFTSPIKAITKPVAGAFLAANKYVRVLLLLVKQGLAKCLPPEKKRDPPRGSVTQQQKKMALLWMRGMR